MNWYRIASTAEELMGYGVTVTNGKAILYRGTDIPDLTINDLRYGEYLSSVPSGVDSTGNGGADSYGKYVEKYEIPIEDIEVSNGELQYKGRSRHLAGTKYPMKIYKAYNDYYGSNYTSDQIDEISQQEVRSIASMALEGGRDEFDQLMEQR